MQHCYNVYSSVRCRRALRIIFRRAEDAAVHPVRVNIKGIPQKGDSPQDGQAVSGIRGDLSEGFGAALYELP